jgi:tRNA(Arg) A34 adenosine deaminase TadA
MEFAWLKHQDKIYFASCRRLEGQPISCVTILIQQIFEQHKDLSFFILRERIFTTRKLTEMDQGMVRLAAKRISQVSEAQRLSDFSNSQLVQLAEPSGWPVEGLVRQFSEIFKTDLQAFQFIDRLIATIPRGEVLHDFNRAIAALLVDSHGHGLVAATNFNSLNKTLHAEVRCLQSLESKHETSEHLRLYVSLKPCRMCAGMLNEVFQSRVEVIYLNDDPGKLAQGSQLESLGRFRKFIAG